MRMVVGYGLSETSNYAHTEKSVKPLERSS